MAAGRPDSQYQLLGVALLPLLSSQSKRGVCRCDSRRRATSVTSAPRPLTRLPTPAAQGLVPHAHAGDGKMEAIVVRKCGRLGFLRFLLRVNGSVSERGRHIRRRGAPVHLLTLRSFFFSFFFSIPCRASSLACPLSKAIRVLKCTLPPHGRRRALPSSFFLVRSRADAFTSSSRRFTSASALQGPRRRGTSTARWSSRRPSL